MNHDTMVPTQRSAEAYVSDANSTLCIEYLPGTVTTSWSREQMHYLYIEIVVIVNN